MPAGQLYSHIILDEPKKVYQGPGDPVRGTISLRWMPSLAAKAGAGNNELFGPLKATVTFWGRAKSKIWERHGNHTSIYRGRAPLFSTTVVIFDASIRLSKGETMLLPFSVSFPSGNQTSVTASQWKDDRRFDTRSGVPLPPSVNLDYHGFAHRYSCFVAYKVSAHVDMPGIDVSITESNEPLVNYEPIPREPPTDYHLLHRRAKLQNELLMPEEERPSGFREKAKAALKSDYYPKFHFEVSLSAPKHIILGERLSFKCRVRPLMEDSTAPFVPDMTLHWLRVTLSANTTVRAELNVLSCHESGSSQHLLSLEGRRDSTPFSKENDWTKTIDTNIVEGAFCSSFKTFNISQTHSLEIKLAILCTLKNTVLEQTVPVIVHPPLLGSPGSFWASESGHPEPSNGPASSAPPTEDLGDAGTAVPVPEYEEPPSYDQVGENAGAVPNASVTNKH